MNKTLIETKEKINEIDKTIDELETIDELFHSVEKLYKKCKETQEAMKKLEE